MLICKLTDLVTGFAVLTNQVAEDNTGTLACSIQATILILSEAKALKCL
jgi:hypothetical protein